MKFWDSSAVVPLAVEQPSSRSCRRLLRADSHQIVWSFARTEVLSALCRLHREGMLAPPALAIASARVERMADRWTEVDAIVPVRTHAEALLHRHALTAADALQLGAALVACDGRPRGRSFISLDDRLLLAATREGFDAVRPAD